LIYDKHKFIVRHWWDE